MQVQPITAIRPLKIRQKPIIALRETREQDPSRAAEFQASTHSPAAPDAHRTNNAYYGAQSEYSAQLLANRLSSARTDMDRTAHLAQYGLHTSTKPSSSTLSISV